mgnify:CR=1 FL=1
MCIRDRHYDEQHPKAGRNQMYRLTLLDSISGQVIADELFDSKDADTIEAFLRRNLDTHKPIFIVTDLYRGYSEIFKRVFGNKVTHQLCLLHLNKLIVNDFPRKTSIEQELVKYKLLNIFYNRDLEIEFLSCLIEEETAMLQKSHKEYKAWIKEAKHLFHEFLHNLELKRRREDKNLELRTYCQRRSKTVQSWRNKTVHLLIPELKLRGCADAGHGGVPRVARFIQPGLEYK